MIRVRGSVCGALLVVLMAGSVVLTACGGSVADSDRRPAARDEPPPVSPFCAALAATAEALAPLAGQGGVPPEELSNTVDAVRRSTDELITAAPGDVLADVESYVAAVDLQLDALLASGGDAAALSDPALQAQLNTPEVDAAAMRLDAYARQTCAATGPATGGTGGS